MADARLEIQRLVLRLPGLTDSEARVVAAAVVERLGNAASGVPPVNLPQVNVRIALESGLPREKAADRIAAAVVEALH